MFRNYPLLAKKSYITVNSWNKKIYIYSDTENNEIIEILYDLIKADIVVKE